MISEKNKEIYSKLKNLLLSGEFYDSDLCKMLKVRPNKLQVMLTSLEGDIPIYEYYKNNKIVYGVLDDKRRFNKRTKKA